MTALAELDERVVELLKRARRHLYEHVGLGATWQAELDTVDLLLEIDAVIGDGAFIGHKRLRS